MQGRLQSLGAEQRRRGVEQSQRAEEPEEEVDPVRRVPDEVPAADQAAQDLVGGEQQPVAGTALQRAGEERDQAPAEQRGDDQAGDEHEQRAQEGAAPRRRVELPAGQDQQGHRRDAQHQRGQRVPVADAQQQRVREQQQGEVAEDEPQRDPLARGHRGGQEEQEDGVGEVGGRGHGQQVQGVRHRDHGAAQRGDERRERAEGAEQTEEDGETVGHPVEETMPGRHPFGVLGALPRLRLPPGDGFATRCCAAHSVSLGTGRVPAPVETPAEGHARPLPALASYLGHSRALSRSPHARIGDIPPEWRMPAGRVVTVG